MSGYQIFISFIFFAGGTLVYQGRREMFAFYIFGGGTKEAEQEEKGLIFTPGLIRYLVGMVLLAIAVSSIFTSIIKG